MNPVNDDYSNSDDTFHFYLKRDGWPLNDVVGYSPGIKLNCPKCNSDKISIFFKPGFIGKEQTPWCDLMDDGNFSLCNDYEIIKKNNYNPNWNCKNCYDGGVILKNIYGELLKKFHKFKKNFTIYSKPVMFDENFNKITLKQIHDISCNTDDPASMIAVTRHQYHVYNFPKYSHYIKNQLGIDTIYYGLWPGVHRVEYDVLYVIPTDDHDTIQKHLNSHNLLNDGVSQRMALVISHDGTTKIIENDN
jgi:ssDNA-binding Zn-finger/Zn-ribbon topoisomerase 1